MAKHIKLLISCIVCSPFPQLSQWRSLPNSAPLASIYVKFFGQEIAFANIDKALFDHVIAVWFKFILKTDFRTVFFFFNNTKL